jgi:hypothetical protein
MIPDALAKRAHKPKAPRLTLMVAAVLAVATLAGLGARWAAVGSHAAALQAEWRTDERLGVPAARLAPLQRRLDAVLEWPVIRRLLTGTAVLSTLDAAAGHILTAVTREDRRQAREAAARLSHLDRPLAEALWQHALHHDRSPRAWLASVAAFEKDERTWAADRVRLGPETDGVPLPLATLASRDRNLAMAARELGITAKPASAFEEALLAFRRAPLPVQAARYPHLLAWATRVETTLSAAIREREPGPPDLSGLQAAISAYLGTRTDTVAVAVLDLVTGKTMTIHPSLRVDTASIIKATIMATLLWDHQRAATPISTLDKTELAPMIEESNNNDATQLWNALGGPPGVSPFLAAAHMEATTPNWAWGLTTTTAPDQIALLKELVLPGGLLHAAAQAYALSLMEHVVGWEAFGVTAGVPAGVTVALKNGWLPVSSGWVVNSIGYVNGDGESYLLAVLTDGNPTMTYGVDTIGHVSGLVWRALSGQAEAAGGAGR